MHAHYRATPSMLIALLGASLSACSDVSPSEPEQLATAEQLAEALKLNPAVESAHPYASDSTRSWRVKAPACASRMRIYFDYIDVEEHYDTVRLSGEGNKKVKSYTGYHRGWSPWVQGGEINVQLLSDATVQGPGFRITGLEYEGGGSGGGAGGTWKKGQLGDSASAIATKHPYPVDVRQSWSLKGPADAQALRVYFENFDTEARYDIVTLYDSSDSKVATYTGQLGNFLSTEVAGNSMRIELSSDYSVAGYGFEALNYEYLTGGGTGGGACTPTEICKGGLDEDGDTLVDCADPDCAGDAACQGCNSDSECGNSEICEGRQCICAGGSHACESGCCTGFASEKVSDSAEEGCSLGVSDAGDPHIALINGTGAWPQAKGHAHHAARLSQDNWSVNRVDYSTQSIALAMDGRDMPALLIGKKPSDTYQKQDLGYWSYDGSAFTRSKATEYVPFGPRIAGFTTVGATPHLVYTSGSHIYHASQAASGEWTPERLTPLRDDAGVWRQIGVGADSQGRTHLGFMSGDALNHAVRVGGEWRTQVVVPAGTQAGQRMQAIQVSLVVDPQDGVHMIYSGDSGDLNYAYSGDMVNWSTESVDTSQANSQRRNATLRLEAGSIPNVVFRDGAMRRVRFARRIRGRWFAETVATEATPGSFVNTLDLDGQGRPHICYYDSQNKAVRYAH